MLPEHHKSIFKVGMTWLTGGEGGASETLSWQSKLLDKQIASMCFNQKS